MKKKTAFIALLSVFAIGSSAGAVMASGCSGSGRRIDAPTELEADLGTYVIPDYNVVDNEGMILAGYNVYLKSVKDADGEELAESYGSAITVDEAGVYSFVYSAGTRKVKDVTVSIDFADRTAPTINCDDSTIPKFFIPGNSYKVPSYTLSGDFVREKCWAKVFYIDGNNAETEVAVESGRFKVDKSSGTYEIRIHVEDAAGNANDYKYARKVESPENVVENKVLYLDEKFGEKQVSCYQSSYTGGFVSKDEEGAQAYEDESGSYKVSFNGETPTQYNEGLLVMDVPAIIDINEYEDLYMFVYNDGENDIIMGSQWWNDTKVPAKQWTKLTWNTRAWGNNMSANNTKPIGLVDITGMTIRFVFDYDQKIIPNGDFYLSAMYATPKIRTELEVGENVVLNGTKYFINDRIDLNAVPIEGKTVDYYKVDGEIIPGDSFIATEEKHKIEVVYADGELTNDNMTWATFDELNPVGDDAQTQYMGNSDYWVMSYDVSGVNDGWKYFGVYVGGNDQLVGIELSDEQHSKFAGYGGVWKWGDGVKLPDEVYTLLRTESEPVKAVFVRAGDEIRCFIISKEKTYFVGAVQFSELGVSGNGFGYGGRSNVGATVENFKAVSGKAKTELYFKEYYKAQLTVNDVKDDGEHYMGDKVTLKPDDAPVGKMFAYFRVNGKRIEGNTFRISDADTVVETIFTDISKLTLGEGISTADGKTGEIYVAQDTYVIFDYNGTVPSGKYFVGFYVDGEAFYGNEIHITEKSHNIIVLFGDKIETGAEKLNDITDTNVLYAQNDDGSEKWKPASVEHVTNVMFTGSDKAVDENSVIKLVTGKDNGENSFAFDNSLVNSLDAYEEIYFYAYTDASGIKAGGWWCGDTDLVAGKWTRISFRRNLAPGTIEGNGDTKVWEAGIEKFAFRIMGAPAGATVYVTAVYGMPYPDAFIRTDENVTVSAPANGTQYKVGETVTLTAKPAPDGKVFAYFTADGEQIEGNKFTLTGNNVFGVVYNLISKIKLPDGVMTADGKTGSILVARNVPVYLKLTDDTKYYVAFSVNGEAIVGNSFIPTEGITYEVTVETADKNTSASSQLNDVSSAAMHDKNAKLEFTDNVYYNGADGAVTNGGSLKITAGGGDVAVKATKAVGGELTGYKEVYFYVYTLDDGVSAGTWWCNDTAAVKGQWTKVTVYRDMNKNSCVGNPYDADGVSGKLFAAGSKGSNFIYRIMGGEGKTIYVTSLYGVPYADATVKIAADSKDSLTVSLPADGSQYKEGETVTLTAAEAPSGKAFAYFTANGKPIEGSTYVLGAGEVTFGVVYNNVSVITLGSGVTAEGAADGELTVGRGATITLVFNGTAPAGKYFKGFAVDDTPIGGNTFVAENEEHTVIAVFEDKIQTESDKLNEIATVADDGLSFHAPNPDWKPEKIEYVTDVKYTGSDGAIDENGSLKVTLKGGEQAFALNKTLINKLDEYKEIYFYIYADKGADVSGIKIGGWWCRDVDIVAGQWTKVSFTRDKAPWNISEKSVWAENSIDKFVYSFDKAKAGTVVYLTAVYGVLYDEVSVTVDDDVKDHVSFTGVCREGQTITLSHSSAPEGQAFAYFTVNNERIEGNTYVLGKQAVVIGAEFSEISTVNLGDGVTVDGATDGKITVGRDASVTLVLDDATAPAGKVFDRFEVDGDPIEGNTFTTKSATHSVTAVFIDKAADMTWNEVKSYKTEGSDIKVFKIGTDTHWVLSYQPELESTGWVYLAAYIGGSDQLLGIEMHSDNDNRKLGGFGGTYKWMNQIIVSEEVRDILRATKTTPATAIYVRNGETLSMYISQGDKTYFIGSAEFSVFEVTGNDFGIGERGDNGINNAVLKNIEYVTGEGKTGLYLDSLKADISFEKAHAEQSVYHLGDTVTLIADDAETGKKFLRFTVNGEPLTGNTFTVKSTERYEVVAEYSDISTLTLGDGVLTADGNTEYARGAKVTLSFDEAKLGGKVVDYYVIDEGKRVFNGEFTTTAATHTVKAVLADVDKLTWADFAAENVTDYEGWVSFCKTGETAEDWIIEYKVTKNVAVGSSLGVYLGSDHWAEIEIGSSEKKLHGHVGGTDYWTKVADLSEDVVTKLQSAGTKNVTLTWIRKGNTLTVVLNKNQCIGKFDFGDAHTGEQEFGTMFRGNATKDMIGDIKFIVGESRVNAYKDYIIKNAVNGQTSEAQINNIYNVTKASDSNDFNSVYITEGIPTGLLDANIKGNGVLKVTATGGYDIGFKAGMTFECDPNKYSEIYFYVYIESLTEEVLNFVVGGSYWKDGGTISATNKWVKISFDSALIAQLDMGNDLSNFVFRIYSQKWENGFTDITNKIFYVTSLYGVPKDIEPVVQNGATNYSLVGGNDELTAILNDNFFPDAE